MAKWQVFHLAGEECGAVYVACFNADKETQSPAHNTTQSCSASEPLRHAVRQGSSKLTAARQQQACRGGKQCACLPPTGHSPS